MSQRYAAHYINFQGKARDAMEFYHNVLAGKLDLYTSDEKGAPKPAAPGDRITHGRLEADGVIIMASDGHPRYPAQVGENTAIVLGGTDKRGGEPRPSTHWPRAARSRCR
jgi:PhnB protein